MKADPARVVILDDDPTGTQGAHGVDVLLTDVRAGLTRFSGQDQRAVYILTNTRAKTPAETTEIITDLSTTIRDVLGDDTLIVLRGDSTLRGHIALEMELLGLSDAVGIVVPAYPAGGRTTCGGVHYVRGSNGDQPAAETEYARDPVFGYSSSRLTDWAAEVGLKGPFVSIDLRALREIGSNAVASALLAAPLGAVLLPDADCDEDIAVIADGIQEARATGLKIVVRAAAPLAAALAGTSARQVVAPSADSVLVACGSHTEGANRQLHQLPCQTRFLPAVDELIDPHHDSSSGLSDLAKQLRADLREHGIAVVASPRQRSTRHGELTHGAAVMEALVRVVDATSDAAGAVVTKGGITGAEIAARGLGADRAEVLGQVVTGVSLWRLHRPGKPELHQVVVPGNVGADTVILDAVNVFRSDGTRYGQDSSVRPRATKC
ncbi:four-carbon acid sugar kinase family protein [Mycolicibacterium sp. 624]|uniref:four-carbon acid sugar kinase family protein n=1 Tax=Mycolicibacterium sp. 624 TaxID=3156314 RepID=UPI003391F31D